MMSFDDGTDTRHSTQAQITESLIRLIAQVLISVGIIGVFLIAVIEGKLDAAQTLQPIAFATIGFWLGQSVVAGWTGVQRDKINAAREKEKTA